MRELVGMRMPRRHPRAVYEVYDAEDMLGEPELPASGGEQAGAEPDPMAEQVAGAADRGAARMASPEPRRSSPGGWAPGRMLAGALLCTFAVCALAGIGVALLHILGGSGAAPVAASPSLRPIGARGDATARIERAQAVKRAKRIAPANPVTPAKAVKSARGVGHVQALRPVGRHDAARRLLAGSDGLLRPRLPAGSDGSLEPQSPQVPPAPSPGCACAAAEVEFGFER